MLRSEFDVACHALIEKYADEPSTPATVACKGWSWNEHTTVKDLGYLSRTTMHVRRTSSAEDSVLETDDDPATAAIPPRSGDILCCCQYVVYSATFQAPAFYFTMHDAGGSVLSLSELVETSLFRSSLVTGTTRTTFGLTQDGSNFPLLSQGDHPTSGNPCWYLHPCETAAAVDELMSADDMPSSPGHLRWMEKWFVVLGTAVNARC